MFSARINRFKLFRCPQKKELRQSHMAVVRSAFSKSSVFAVHTNTLSPRFQIYPLWRAFSKSSVSGHRKLRFQIYPAQCGRSLSLFFLALVCVLNFSSLFLAQVTKQCSIYLSLLFIYRPQKRSIKPWIQSLIQYMRKK